MSAPAAFVWLKELDPDRGQLTMDRAIAKLRDEITGVSMDRHRGNSRELAFVMAKLDEARQWAITYLETRAEVQLVHRAEIMQRATDTTVATDV